MKFKTAKAAIANHFINGGTMTISDCFKLFGVTNLPREIKRLIEDPFGIKIERTPVLVKTRYCQGKLIKRYSLIKNKNSKLAISRMAKYINEKSIKNDR